MGDSPGTLQGLFQGADTAQAWLNVPVHVLEVGVGLRASDLSVLQDCPRNISESSVGVRRSCILDPSLRREGVGQVKWVSAGKRPRPAGQTTEGLGDAGPGHELLHSRTGWLEPWGRAGPSSARAGRELSFPMQGRTRPCCPPVVPQRLSMRGGPGQPPGFSLVGGNEACLFGPHR